MLLVKQYKNNLRKSASDLPFCNESPRWLMTLTRLYQPLSCKGTQFNNSYSYLYTHQTQTHRPYAPLYLTSDELFLTWLELSSSSLKSSIGSLRFHSCRNVVEQKRFKCSINTL